MSGPKKFNKPVCKILHMDWSNHKYQYRLRDELVGSSLAEENLEILVDEKFDSSPKVWSQPRKPILSFTKRSVASRLGEVIFSVSGPLL